MGGFTWIGEFRNHGAIVIAEQEREEFFSSLLCSATLPALDLPALWTYEEVTVEPRKCLRIFQPRLSYKKDGMRAELSFEYEGRAVEEHAQVRGFYEAQGRRFIRRDTAAEQAAAAELLALGLRFAKADWSEDAGWIVAVKRIPRVVQTLASGGLAGLRRRNGISSSRAIRGLDIQRRGLVRVARRGCLRRDHGAVAPVVGRAAAGRHHGDPG